MTSTPRSRVVERLGFQIAFVLAVALLPLTLISMINSLRAAEETHARSEVALTGETMLAAANEIRMIQEARGAAAAIASLIGPVLDNEAACSDALRTYVAAHKIYSQVSFVPVSGQLVCSSSGKHFDVSKSPIFQDTINAQRPSFSANRNGVISGTSVLGVSHPVFGPDGTYLGYIGLSLPHSELDVTLGTAGKAGPLEVMTFDRDGEILVATGGLDNAGASLPRDRALVTLKTDHPMAFSAISQSGQSRVFSIVPLVPGELFALGTWPVDQTGSISAMLFSIPFLAPALIWVGSLVVAWLSVERLVNRPIRHLNVSINALRAATD